MKKIAAVVSSYFPNSHADVIVTKLMKGIPTDTGLLQPRVELASLYIDQMHEQDVGHSLAYIHGVPVYQSIETALTLGTDRLAVDGVLVIGEHGEYPFNELGQQLYPRRYFFEQVCGVFGYEKRSVPVFVDKGLSYSWDHAHWMYRRAHELGVPLMAGSSIPSEWRSPPFEYPVGTNIEEALVVGYGPLERYGFHALEGLQSMVERRKGGESGIKAVRYLVGDAVWEAGRRGDYSRELVEAACSVVDRQAKTAGDMEQDCPRPHALLLEYNDGLRATVLLLNGYLQQSAFAGRSDGKVQATAFVGQGNPPFAHFSYLLLNVEEMFLTGTPSYPVERTLLTTGALDAIMLSRHRDSDRLETPHLDVCYTPVKQIPWRPAAEAPSGACVDVWPPKVTRTRWGKRDPREIR